MFYYLNKDLYERFFLKIVSKFKNYPVPVGGILMMYNTLNPAELYSGTTWELLATDKYLRTTTGTPLSTGGSNSFTIVKGNLPTIKLKVDTFSVTTKPHKHSVTGGYGYGSNRNEIKTKSDNTTYTSYTNEAGGENTGTASPSTEILGSGTSISVNPTYITIRAWKRLT